MTAKLCYPTKYFPENQAMTVPVLSVGVPRAPDFVNDYTSMGPDIVASWRPGGPFRRLGGNEIRTANRASSIGVAAAFAGTKGSSKNYGLSIRYTFGHALHPWHAKYLVASPGFDEVAYDGGLGGPVGFPHSAAEIFRRRYAIKNRTEPLWWFVTVFPGDSDLPYSNLVRHKLRFKLQSAFRTALKQRGYNLVGVRLDGLDGKLARFQQLYGSVRVDGMTQPLLDVTYDELVAYLCQVVVAVEGHLGGRKQGQTLPKQKRPGRLGRPDKADPAPEDGWTADEEGFQVVGSGTRQGGGLAKANSDLQPKPSKGSAKPYKSRGKQSDDDFVVLRGLGY
ncbi:hypothetical protein SBRCBS47491_000412 [Sporothrix bragantina]|uniref:Uncharacterized protein n=1 Tax=Sporothrix bragantina TaxID=671064 RepID=A0ABP0AQ66_9PEZI